ncbi:MAG: hypothetical protein WCF04_03750 [Candidatus Nanopelagicales bacterium]
MAQRNRPNVPLPDRRRLQVFGFDPMSTRMGGRVLTVDVPFERDLRPGPWGDLVQVVDYDPAHDVWYSTIDLDDPAVLARGGLLPSERDPRTHQQVAYAVAMSVIERFERFGGKRFRWRGGRQLRLVPHAFEGRNAYFDPRRRAVLFGYFRADALDPGANLPGQMIFTCLSVDIIAHEVTHAIVHRLRRYLSEPTNPDVLAWHEACADLVALFHHFAFPDVVAEAVADSHGELEQGSALLDLALEFGESTGRGGALRSAIGSPRTPMEFLAATEPHARGACFVAGVFDAYLDSYRARIADLRRLATGGTGVLPPGALPPDLVARVTEEAVKNADRILGMVVRAFDFMPAVDVTFGDVLRAIVTADRALFPEDSRQLRAQLVEALRRRGIYPTNVSSLAEEALTWPRPVTKLSLASAQDVDLAGLILRATRDLDIEAEPEDLGGDLRGVPRARGAAEEEATSGGGSGRAGATVEGETREGATGDRLDLDDHPDHIGRPLRGWAAKHALELGLAPRIPMELAGVHVAYLQAADRQPRPVVVVQIAQRREDLEDQAISARRRVAVRAGTTVIARVDGRVEYLVPKPLPLPDPTIVSDLDEPLAGFVRTCHDMGVRRLAQMRKWSAGVEAADPLSAWTSQPALRRLTFARLHSDELTGQG